MKHLFSDFEWSAADRGRAQAEGWDVFDNGTSLCIDRVDEAKRFSCAAEAMHFVADMARAGGQLHARALFAIAREIVEEQLHETALNIGEVSSDIESLRGCSTATHPNWSVSCRSQETLLQTAFEWSIEHPLVVAHKLWVKNRETAVLPMSDYPTAPTMRLVEELQHLRIEINDSTKPDPELLKRYTAIHAEVATRLA